MKETTQKPNKELEQLLQLARMVCDEKAYDRITNVMHVNPELFKKAVEFCFMSYRRTREKVNDELLRSFLERISSSQKKETKIMFKRK